VGFSLKDRRAIAKDSKAPPCAQRVLLALLLHARYHRLDCTCTEAWHVDPTCTGGPDLKCWPSVRALSEITNVDRAQVRLDIDVLIDLGIVTKEPRTAPGSKRHLSNVYHILLRP